MLLAHCLDLLKALFLLFPPTPVPTFPFGSQDSQSVQRFASFVPSASGPRIRASDSDLFLFQQHLPVRVGQIQLLLVRSPIAPAAWAGWFAVHAQVVPSTLRVCSALLQPSVGRLQNAGPVHFASRWLLLPHGDLRATARLIHRFRRLQSVLRSVRGRRLTVQVTERFHREPVVLIPHWVRLELFPSHLRRGPRHPGSGLSRRRRHEPIHVPHHQ